jgi:hypothetical protein
MNGKMHHKILKENLFILERGSKIDVNITERMIIDRIDALVILHRRKGNMSSS